MRCPTLSELPAPPPRKIGWPWTEESPRLPGSMPDGTPWPPVSIVTPSYNQAQFIEETILSVKNQDYPSIEHIIVDGGSTDSTLDILKRYEGSYNMCWISEPDDGQADAIRKGFDMSHGQVLAWINSDDSYLPGAVFKVARFFAQHPEADLVFGNVYLIDERGSRIGELRFTTFDFDTLIYEGGNLHQTGAFWTQEVYKKVGGIDAQYRFCMDFDFFCRVAEQGRIVHLRQHLANFRLHPTAKSSRIADVGRVEHETIVRRYLPDGISPCRALHRKWRCRMKRFTEYTIQGDVDYALRGLARGLWRRSSSLQVIEGKASEHDRLSRDTPVA